MMEMNAISDAQLLRRYVENGDEAAFRDLVVRHTDLLYSAALRQVSSPDLAADLAQSVFIDLARKARELLQTQAGDASLLGWLYRSTRFAALKHLRDDRRRQAHERQVMDHLEPAAEDQIDWERVQPLLDEAMSDLGEEDRQALLLRFFKNHDFRAIGELLGVSDDTAQKRVSRALDKLRALFARRGMTATAAALSAALSANAVTAAPEGLAAAFSAAALAKATTAAATATAQAIAMTTLQKAIITATLAAAVGLSIYEARQASKAHAESRTLRQQHAPLVEQVEKMTRERDDLASELASLRNGNQRPNPSNSEVLKLRGQVGMLRLQLADGSDARTRPAQPPLTSAGDYYQRAMQHESAHEYEAELEDLNKALEMDPTLTQALFDRASLYAQKLPKDKGGIEKAVADYTRFLDIQPNDCAARHNRGLYYEQLRQFDNAIADYTALIEGDTDFSHVGNKDKQLALDYFYRGRAYQWYKKDYARAIPDFNQALRLDPSAEGVHRHRGQCYEALGQADLAQADFAIEQPN